jgi:CBS domain-containing protein
MTANATQKLKDIMTTDVVTCPTTATLTDVARTMKERDIGNVILVDGDTVFGIATDRDIVVRGLAVGCDPQSPISEVATTDLVTLSPDDDVARAVDVMRERAVRRLPVVDQGKPVGIVSLGDLAIERDSDSALADISAAPADE